MKCHLSYIGVFGFLFVLLTALSQNGFSALTSDFVDLTYYHGYNSEDKKKSCCKWGRANGYAMFAKVEALHTFQLYAQINIRNAAESDMVRTVLLRHSENERNLLTSYSCT